MSRKDRFLCAALVLAAAGFLGVALWGPDGIPEVRRLQGEKADLVRDLAEMGRRERDLVREIRALQAADPRIIERRARADLGMVRKGETLFLLPDADATSR